MLRLRRRRKSQVVDRKELDSALKAELKAYMTREELRGYLEGIRRDEEKRKLWDSLPDRKKLQVLKHALRERGKMYGKK